MAAFGAKYPCFAPFAEEETDAALPTYEGGVVLGELNSANCTVTLASGQIEGDDIIVEQISEISSADIPMETVDMLDNVTAVVYGAEYDEQTG